MDYTNALRDEIFRPTMTILSPGAIAATPWIAVLYSSQVHNDFAKEHVALAITSLLLIFAIVGLLMDNLGARLETYLDNKLTKENGYADHLENWHKYWRVAFKEEPVGHRYLRTRVLMLKFELNTFASLVVGLVGILFLAIAEKLTWPWFFGLLVGGVVFASYLYKEAGSSVRLLSDIRREILKGVGEPPISSEE